MASRISSSAQSIIKRYPLLIYALSSIATAPVVVVAAYKAYERVRNWRFRPRFDSRGFMRPLSLVESYYSSRNLAGLKPNFYMAVNLTGKPWTLEEAQKFVKVAMVKHAPSLFTIFDEDLPSVRPIWRRLWHPSYSPEQQGIIDIKIEARETPDEADETWKRVGARIEDEGFQFVNSVPRDPRLTQFRISLVVHPDSDHWELVFLPHHAMFDAYGALEFLKAIFVASALERAQPGSTPDIDLTLINIEGSPRMSSQMPIKWPKSTEQLFDANLGFRTWARTILPFYFPLITRILPWVYYQEPSKSWVGPVKRETPFKPTSSTTWCKIPSSVLTNLYDQLKHNETTINSAIWAAICYAAHVTHRHMLRTTTEPQSGVVEPPKYSQSSNTDLKFAQPTGRILLGLHNPINLRPRAKSDETSNWSCVVTAVTPEVWIDLDEEFWSICRNVQSQVKELAKSCTKGYGAVHHFPRPAVPWMLSLEDGGHNGREVSFALTNGGRVNVKDSIEGSDKKLLCRDLWFARHGINDGHLFVVTAITPEGGDLNLTITGVEELTPKETQNLFQEAVIAILSYAAQHKGPFLLGKFESEAGSRLLAM